MNIASDFGANIIVLQNATGAISNAAQQMGDNINTFAQQNALINNDFADLQEEITAYGDPERAYLLWNNDNITVYVHGVIDRVKRGSKVYKDLVAAGYVEDGRWMMDDQT